jgi:hypothetical protein
MAPFTALVFVAALPLVFSVQPGMRRTQLSPQRRQFFSSTAAFLVVAPTVANAERGFLSSKPLEYMRIKEQRSADDIKYGGELAATDAPTQPVLLLIAIAKIELALLKVAASVEQTERWESLQTTLRSAPFSKIEFKKAFNSYSDNIYYGADSGRANVYLGGGATPTTLQTTQYMLRNEVLTNVELAATELDYLIRLRDGKTMSREAIVADELEDLRGFLAKALANMGEYLSIPPATDVELARKLAAVEPKPK